MKMTTLKFEYHQKTYISKPFDFEALCLINDHHGDKDTGIFRMAAPAVRYMFDGTEATSDIINKLPLAEMSRLCREAWEMYLNVIKNE